MSSSAVRDQIPQSSVRPRDERPRRTIKQPSRPPASARARLVGLAGLSLLVVVGLWIANGGFSGFRTSALALTSLGRLTGLVAADLLLLQVLLMARIPTVERAFGQDALARTHRQVGFLSFDLMLVHVVLITLGYAFTDRVSVWREAWHLVADYPGMLLATVGTALLIVVVGLSIRAARRRLRYESWHLIHLYAYLGVGLALPHELWTGADFIASPLARIYWWGLWGAAVACIVVFRLGAPLFRSARHGVRVAGVVEEAPGVISVHLRGRNLNRLESRAGQFFHWRFLDGPGWSRAHPYSLSSAPNARRLRITVKETGDGSERLRSLRPGTRVLFEGPYGRLTRDVRSRRRVVLLASGIGITPMRSLLEEFRGPDTSIVLIYRARSEQDIVFRRELDALSEQPGVRVVYVLGPRAADGSWLPVGAAHLTGAEALRRIVHSIAKSDVYVCGPDAWMDAVSEAASEAGVPQGRIHIERFSW